MPRVILLLAAAAAALAAAGAAAAAPSSWAARADKVCTTWQSRAKTSSLATRPKTTPQMYAWAVKATAFEQRELAALEQVPGVTAAGRAALAAVRTDIAEISVGLRDWRAGDRTGFLHVFVKWQGDHRPHRAFVAAGARACG